MSGQGFPRHSCVAQWICPEVHHCTAVWWKGRRRKEGEKEEGVEVEKQKGQPCQPWDLPWLATATPPLGRSQLSLAASASPWASSPLFSSLPSNCLFIAALVWLFFCLQSAEARSCFFVLPLPPLSSVRGLRRLHPSKWQGQSGSVG